MCKDIFKLSMVNPKNLQKKCKNFRDHLYRCANEFSTDIIKKEKEMFSDNKSHKEATRIFVLDDTSIKQKLSTGKI